MFEYLCNTKGSLLILLRRRIITFPLHYILFSSIAALSALLAVPAVIVDLVTWKIHYTRRIAWGLFYSLWSMSFVTCALLASPFRAVIGLFSGEAALRIPEILKKTYYTGIARGFRFIYSVQLFVEGDAEIRKDTSSIFFINHTAYIDPVFPVETIMWNHGIALRHVLWRGLLLDAAVDLGVSSFGEAVVDPDNRVDYQEDLSQIARLIARQKPGHGIAVYPEGGVGAAPGETPLFKHTNNPRLAGMLFFLEEDAESDVVFVAHRGLKPGKLPGQIWKGTMTGRSIDVKFVVIARNEIPEDIEDREAFIMRHWKQMDDWIGETGDE